VLTFLLPLENVLAGLDSVPLDKAVQFQAQFWRQEHLVEGRVPLAGLLPPTYQ
jgi:hypothetical protein